MTGPRDQGLVVVKIGGGLTSIPGALQQVCSVVRAAGRQRPILIVPGGGPFADLVREFDRTVGLSAEAAHWMAVLGMDQYAHVLADLIPGSVLIEDPGNIRESLAGDRVAILAPSRWMRSADVLPRDWSVTSDSIAAFVAGALGAHRLVLVKPTASPVEAVDPCFNTVLPADLPYDLVSCTALEELAGRLRM
jgi:5-(aminomethyl)-3-furanmethanol phosphate kinase